MTPLEQVGKAIWENQKSDAEGDEDDVWEKNPEWVKSHFVATARVALLALAKLDMPPSALKAGARAVANDDRYGGGTDVKKARDSFSAMLRAIAEAKYDPT